MPRILVVDDNPELLALLSSSFEDAGYTVQTAQRGRAAIDLAKKDRPDLALIDVLLPDVMGFEVGEALQKQKIPVAFMSGVHKGGKAAANATFKYGAVGYFEKPFDRKAVLAMVSQLVPVKAQTPKPAWDVEAAEGVEGPGDAMELTGQIDLTSGDTYATIQGAKLKLRGESPVSSAGAPPPAPPSSPGRISSPGSPPSRTSSLGRTSSPGSRSGTPRPPVLQRVPPVLQPAVYTQANSIPPTPLRELLKVTRPTSIEIDLEPLEPLPEEEVPPARPPPPPLEALTEIPRDRNSVHRGDIDDNLPQLFAAFLAAQETGELGLSRGQVKKIVYFEKGMPVFALSNLVAERLGQFLVRAGKIDEETLKAALQEANDTSQRTGDVLILMGLLTEQERLYYVGQQIKSILYSLFAWTEGQYTLTFQDKARAERIKLDIHPATLVMRGIKKLYKPARMARILALDDKPIPGVDPLFSLSDIELQGWEALMVARCDGTRPTRELLASSGKPEPEALGTLVALVSMRVLEKRR